MLDKVKAVLAHMRVLFLLRKPSGFAAREKALQTEAFGAGMKLGVKLGKNQTLSDIACMPRHARRQLVSGAVKTFGRKPRKAVDGFRPGMAEDEQDALAYLRGQDRAQGWPDWQRDDEGYHA